MRSIIIIIYVISIPALKNNNLDNYIGELEKIVEIIQVGLFTVTAVHPCAF